MKAGQNSMPWAPGASPIAGPSLRTWLGVVSLAVAAAAIVTAEFIPVGFLPNVAADLHVTLGTAGLMVLVPGLSAAIAAPLVIVGAGGLDRRYLVVMLTSLVVVSNAIAWAAPDFAIVLFARVFLGIAIGGFWAVVPSLGIRLVGPGHGTRATSIVLAGLSAGTVIGLPAGQLLGNLIGWRLTFAAVAAATIPIVAAQLLLLPRIAATTKMRFTHLGGVFRIPIARITLIAMGSATTGQFAASTFVTPFLRQNANLGAAPATVLLLGYGLAGIAGTLLGSRPVARSPIWTFVSAATSLGAVLMIVPVLSGTTIAVGVLIVAWGFIWGFVPLSLQTRTLTANPSAPEASSAAFITVAQLAIAAGSALGGVLVDSAGLAVVFLVSGTIMVTAGLLGLLARSRTGDQLHQVAPQLCDQSVSRGSGLRHGVRIGPRHKATGRGRGDDPAVACAASWGTGPTRPRGSPRRVTARWRPTMLPLPCGPGRRRWPSNPDRALLCLLTRR